ncbi:MAG: hypothetical protein ACLTTP_08725, partial [Alistipes ihumii]
MTVLDVVGGFDLPARFRGVLPADFVGVRFALGLAVALVQLDSLAAVGIVESSGELDVNLRFAIDFPVAQQPVDQDPQAEQCPHRHRIAYC